MHLRPAVRPGAAILRRDAHHLQIGTAPGVVVRDRPGLLPFLLSLDGTRGLDQLPAGELVDPAGVTHELVAAGAVVDAAHWDNRELTEARSRSLAGLPDVGQHRRALRVDFHSDTTSERFAGTVRQILRHAGVVHVDADDPTLVVLVTSGEPPRSVPERLTQDGICHLVVRSVEDRVMVGPLVLPGATACLSCHDLHRTDWDPKWSVLIPQFGHRSPHHNPAAPNALTSHTAAVAVADVVLSLADPPHQTCRGVVAIGPHHQDRDVRSVGMHPRCFCSLLPSHRTDLAV